MIPSECPPYEVTGWGGSRRWPWFTIWWRKTK